MSDFALFCVEVWDGGVISLSNSLISLYLKCDCQASEKNAGEVFDSKPERDELYGLLLMP